MPNLVQPPVSFNIPYVRRVRTGVSFMADATARNQLVGNILWPKAVNKNLVRKRETALVGGDNLIMEILLKTTRTIK